MAVPPQIDTLIFVDIDGVLNVGIYDGEQAPLLLNQENRRFAMSRGSRRPCGVVEKQCVEKVLAVAERQLEDGSGETFCSLVCGYNKQCSDVLIRRLAGIIASAGGRRLVILASNWRKPKYAGRVRRLEAEISRHLGERFSFDARTRPAEESGAADRLRCIGDFVQSHVAARAQAGPLRVLVMDDFFITPLDGWSCDGTEVSSPRDAEGYLQGRAGTSEVTVRVLHPYAEWDSKNGLRVRVGAGLSPQHCEEASAFLGAAVAGVAGVHAAPPEERKARAKGTSRVEGDQALGLGSESNTLKGAVDSAMMASLAAVCFSGCLKAVPWLCIHL